MPPGTLIHHQDSQQHSGSNGNKTIAQFIEQVQQGLGNNPPVLPDNVVTYHHPQGVIHGIHHVMHQMIAMVSAAAHNTPMPGAEILLIAQHQQRLREIVPEIAPQWDETVNRALARGWDFVHLWNLSNKPQQRLLLVTCILSRLGLQGQYKPYYFSSETTSHGAAPELLIVPGQGALMMFGVHQPNYTDTAFFFFPESDHVHVLRQYFATLQTQTKPILKVFTAHSLEFAHAILQSEMGHGEQRIVKYGLMKALIPNTVNMQRGQRILRELVGNKEQGERITWHQSLMDNRERRIFRFLERMQQCPTSYILPKSGIQHVLDTGYLARDDWESNLAGSQLTSEEIILCLQNVINLLRTYPHFQVGLFDDESFNINPVTWTTNGSHTVIIQTWRKLNDTTSEREEIGVAIYEPTIVQAFCDYFDQMWKNLPPESKDKAQVIAWLNEQIEHVQHK